MTQDLAPVGVNRISTMIIDTPDNCSGQIVHLQADSVTSVFRYLTYLPGSWKLVTPDEARALAAANIRLGLVYEAGGGAPGQPTLCAVDGTRDGAFAVGYVDSVGASPNACIYFAADNDFGQDQVNKQVLPYFEAVAKEFVGSSYRVGVYGSGLVCQSVVNAGFASMAWLSGSLGWNSSRELLSRAPSWLAMLQTQEDTHLANMDVDMDSALQSDIGDFLAFESETNVPQTV